MSRTTGEFEELIERARTGDRSAQGHLLDTFRGYLKVLADRQLDRRVGVRLDASDVVQQTCITALASIEQFRGTQQGEFIAWLKTVHEHVVQNLARDHVRTQKRSVKRENRVTGSQLVQLGGPLDQSTPSQNLMKGEAAVKLALALETLPPDQREAVRLRYCEGCSLDQIAQNMQRTKPAVAGLLKRGLAALRKRIE